MKTGSSRRAARSEGRLRSHGAVVTFRAVQLLGSYLVDPLPDEAPDLGGEAPAVLSGNCSDGDRSSREITKLIRVSRAIRVEGLHTPGGTRT